MNIQNMTLEETQKRIADVWTILNISIYPLVKKHGDERDTRAIREAIIALSKLLGYPHGFEEKK